MSLKGQNLVNDPSFEEYKRCPIGLSNVPLKYWDVPTKGSTDYYNKCSRKMRIPNNLEGFQYPKSGKGYVGIVNSKRFFSKPGGEYIQTKLKKELIKDSMYYVEFYVSLADYSGQVAKNMGAYFSKTHINIPTHNILNFSPQVSSKEYITDTINWVKISGVFKAKGGEKYLIIGVFGDKKSFKKSTRKLNPKIKGTAYYYIDDVCVSSIHKGENCNCEGEPQHQDTVKKDTNTFAPGKPIILPDITFMVNKWELQDNVKPLLDSLSNYLKEHKKYRITISGHTDNTGTEQYNQILSEQRAESVKEYLLSKGIAPEQIETKGYGSKQPVSDNNTELGRSKNRRVEIMIIE